MVSASGSLVQKILEKVTYPHPVRGTRGLRRRKPRRQRQGYRAQEIRGPEKNTQHINTPGPGPSVIHECGSATSPRLMYPSPHQAKHFV
ncbi:unnamed protein product [Urochloa humidicola]